MSIRNPQSTIHTQNLLLVGSIGKTHGLKGEVKVIPETDDPSRFEDLDTVFVGPDAEQARPHPVASVRYQQSKRGTTVLLKLEDIDTVEAAEALRNRLVFAREEDLPPLDDDEFFLHDLLDLKVVTEDGDAIGTVKDILELRGHEVIVVDRPGQSDALIPAVPEFIVDIDFDEQTLIVQLIDGLLD